MASDGLRWPQMASDGLRWPQMASDGLRWPQRLNVTVILAGGYSQEEEK